MPTEATVASVIVSKYADHLPLYRQAQIYSRQGVDPPAGRGMSLHAREAGSLYIGILGRKSGL